MLVGGDHRSVLKDDPVDAGGICISCISGACQYGTSHRTLIQKVASLQPVLYVLHQHTDSTTFCVVSRRCSGWSCLSDETAPRRHYTAKAVLCPLWWWLGFGGSCCVVGTAAHVAGGRYGGWSGNHGVSANSLCQ